MRVLLAVHHFPPRYRGGTEQNVLSLADSLSEQGHEVRVVCVESLSSDERAGVTCHEEEYEGLPVSRLEIPRPRPERFAASYDDEEIGAWIEDLLRRQRFDVVHLHSGYLLSGSVVEAALRQGVPPVVTLHDYWFLCPRTVLLRPGLGPCEVPERAGECAWCLALDKRRFRLTLGAAPRATWAAGTALAESPEWARRLGVVPDALQLERRRETLRRVLERAAAVLVPTRFLRDRFVAAGFPAARFELVPLGVDGGAAAPAAAPRAVRLSYTGQIAPHKGLHVLLRAWASLGERRSSLRLTVYGDLDAAPAYARRLRALAAGDPSLRFAGPFDRARRAAVLADSDAVVVPSLWYENSSQSVMEALAAGVPVLASRIGALPELVEHEVDGLLFPPGDVGALATCVRRLLDEAELLPRLRARLRRPRGAAAEAAAVAGVYERVAAERRGP